jgi:hypothetical protein
MFQDILVNMVQIIVKKRKDPGLDGRDDFLSQFFPFFGMY